MHKINPMRDIVITKRADRPHFEVILFTSCDRPLYQDSRPTLRAAIEYIDSTPRLANPTSLDVRHVLENLSSWHKLR